MTGSPAAKQVAVKRWNEYDCIKGLSDTMWQQHLWNPLFPMDFWIFDAFHDFFSPPDPLEQHPVFQDLLVFTSPFGNGSAAVPATMEKKKIQPVEMRL